MNNYELTDVAKEMGFSSLDDKVQIKVGENYRGLDIVIKRLSPIGLGMDENEKDTRTFADLIKEHEHYKDGFGGEFDNESFGMGFPSVWYTGYIRLTGKYQKHTIDQLESITQFHGGITYQHLDDDGRFTIGFDCGHFNDVSNVFATKHGLRINDDNDDISGSGWLIWNVDRVRNELTDAIDRLIEYGDAKDEL